MKKSFLASAGLPAALLFLFAATAHAADYTLTLKDNKFSPAELAIPADQKVKLTVRNLDATPAEFESYDLNREKVVGAKSEITLFVGPLKPGRYAYFDDFHHDTTKGTLVVN